MAEVTGMTPDRITQEINKEIAKLQTFRGSGSPEGKVSATVGSTYTDVNATNGAIRWIKTRGTGNTGWSVEYGDTGWRSVPELFPIINVSALAHEVKIRRVNERVDIIVRGVMTVSGQFVSEPLSAIGHPSASYNASLGLINSANTEAHLGNTHTYNRVRSIIGFYEGDEIHATVSYITNAYWPSSLPGIPY